MVQLAEVFGWRKSDLFRSLVILLYLVIRRFASTRSFILVLWIEFHWRVVSPP